MKIFDDWENTADTECFSHKYIFKGNTNDFRESHFVGVCARSPKSPKRKFSPYINRFNL